MEIKDLLLMIIPLAIAIVSPWLVYSFGIKSKKDENIVKFKEEKYGNLLVLLQGFVGETASSELKKKFFEEQYKSWLYASDQVIVSINELVDFIKDKKGAVPDPKIGKNLIGNIVLEMRKDLLGDTALNKGDFSYTDVITKR